MTMIRKIAAALLLSVFFVAQAAAQSSPNLRQGQVPTAAQWNSYFAAKQDVLTFAPATLGANTFTGTQTINPPTGTITKGLSITQRFPSSGSPVGPILGNTIDVTNPGISASGTGVWDSFGIKNLIYASRTTMSVTGSSGGAGSGAFGAISNIAAPSDGFGAALGVTVTGATTAGHYMWGSVHYAVGFSGSASGALIGMEAEVGVGTGGTVGYRIGVSSNSQGPVKGTTLDAAFSANTINNVIPGSSTTSAPWEHLMALSGLLYVPNQFPISTTGDFFYSDIAGTVAHFANLPNVTVTGNILSFPGLIIAGNGGAVFGGGAPPGPGNVLSTAPSAGSVLLAATPNSTIGAAGVTIKDSTTNSIAFFGTFEASNTAVRFGQTVGNWSEMISTGTTSAGLLIGTVTSDPLIIGTNNTARMTLSAAGVFTVAGATGIGSAIAPDTTLMVNSNTGAPVAPVLNVEAHLVAANGLNGGILSDVYGGEALFVGRASSGLQASMTARAASSPYMALIGRTWDGSAYATSAFIEFSTINLQSVSDHSAKARLVLVPSGSTTLTDVMLWGPGVAIGSGAADPGAGNLNLGGGVLQNNGTGPTGTGAYVRAASPALTTPNLGTPSALVLTNATGLPCGAMPALTGDVTTSAGNCATTLTNAPVIAKVLTGFTSGAGTVSAADSILAAFQKIDGNVALKAPLASPALTGVPVAPTAAVDTNTTQLATTAMVLGQAASATPLGPGTAAAGTSNRYARGDHVHPIPPQLGMMAVSVTGVNFNSANSDTAVAFTLPAGFTRVQTDRILITNASAPLSTSTFGFFTATGGGGVAIIPAGTANIITTSADNTPFNSQNSQNTSATVSVASALPTPNTLYFRVGTAQGSAATATVTLFYRPLP